MSAHAEVCHNTLVDFTGEEAFEAADDLASGPAASRPADDDRAMEGGAAREQTVIGEGVEGFSQVGWRIHDDLLQRDHRRGTCFPGRIPRDLELPDHLDDTVPGFGGRGRLARQHGPGGALGIDGVGLADGAARVPVPPIHCDDPMPRAADRAGQAGAIAADALDAKRP